MKKIMIIWLALLIFISFGFARDISVNTGIIDSSKIILNPNQCNDYCKDGIFYYNGVFNSRLNICQYEQRECDYGCSDDNSICSVKVNIRENIREDIDLVNTVDISDIRTQEEEKEEDKKITLNFTKQIDIDRIDIRNTKFNISEKDEFPDEIISNYVIKKGPLLYIPNGKIIVMDTTTNEEIARISLRHNVYKTALSTDDSILYVIYSGKEKVEGTGYLTQGFLALINTTTNEIIREIDLGYFITPFDIKVAPDDKVYVSWKHFSDSKNYPGYTIFDFKKNLVWEIHNSEQYKKYRVLSYDFNDDGSKVYMSMIGSSPQIYMIDWKENMAYTYRGELYKHFIYLDSLTATKNAETLYFIDYYKKSIGYMRTSDNSLQRWFEDYIISDIEYSKTRKALFSVGYKDDTPILNKMTGLMGISYAWPVETQDFSTSDSSSFYISNKRVNLNFPKDMIPDRIFFSPDEKYLYITSTQKDSYGGDRILIYDSDTLQYKDKIDLDLDYGGIKIAITKNKIAWDPSPEFEIIDGIMANNIIDMSEIIKNPYVQHIIPEDGAENVFIDSGITIDFSQNIDANSVNKENLIILNSHYSGIDGTFETEDNKIKFIPQKEYSKNSTIYITVTDRVKGTDGSSAIWSNHKFKTGNMTKEKYFSDFRENQINIKTDIINPAPKVSTQKIDNKSSLDIESSIISKRIQNEEILRQEPIRNNTEDKNNNLTEKDNLDDNLQEKNNQGKGAIGSIFDSIGNFFKSIFKGK